MAEGSQEQEKDKVAPGRLTAGDHATKGKRAAPGRLTLTSEMEEGVPLPSPLRAKFEASLGRDLSAVRVHTGDAAHEQAAGVNARAYALGNDIYFAKGQYNPGTREGDHLIAHEVAHTQQQQGAMASLGKTTLAATTATTTPGDRAETNADSVALAMLRGKPAAVSAESAAIARKGANESIDVPTEAKDAGDAGGGGAGPAGADAKAGEGATEDLKVERVGAEEIEGTEPVGPPQRLEEGKQEIAAKLKEVPPDGGAEELKNGAPKVEGAGGGGGGGGGAGGGEQVQVSEEMKTQIAAAKADADEGAQVAKTEADAYKAEMTARADRFDAEQQALTIEQLKTMSAADKRSTLIEMGFPEKDVKKMKDAELDGIIEGKIATEQRKTRILGMSEEELAALSPDRKMQFLVDLGVDRGDLQKIGPQKTAAAFDDVIRQSKIPGQHKVKIKIKGGLFGKSWEVKVNVDAEGGATFDVQKKGGFFSKLWGWVKAALPIIAVLLAGVTGGASLIALAVYQTVTAIASGDWLGAIIGVAGALVGVGALQAITKSASGAANAFKNIAQVAGKVQKVAQSAKAAMVAAKAKSPGGLLAALATGASAFASIAEKAAQKFAETMTKWGERLEKWSNIVQGGEKVISGIKTGDPAAAVAGAFDAASAAVSKKDKDGKETSDKAKDLGKVSTIAGFASAGTRAAKGKPPDYAGIVESAMGIAGELKAGQAMDDAVKITSAAARLTRAIQKNDPGELAAAALGVAEAIQNAKYDAGHTGTDGKPAASAEEKEKIAKRYRTMGNVVKFATSALKAAAKEPRPDYIAALDAATGLIAELTDSKLVDRAATLTSKFDTWTKAVQSKNEAAIIAAGRAFGEAINEIRADVAKERAEAKKAAEANLAPGETVADEGPAEIPQIPISSGLPAGIGTPVELGGPPGSEQKEPVGTVTTTEGDARINLGPRDSTPGANYIVFKGDSLGRIALAFKVSLAVLRERNPQLVGDKIYEGQHLFVPGADVLLNPSVDVDTKITLPGQPSDGDADGKGEPPDPDKVPKEIEHIVEFIKSFAKASALESELATQMFETWEAWQKAEEKYRKAGQSNTAAYKSVVANLKAIKETTALVDLAYEEFNDLRTLYGEALDGARANTARLEKFKTAIGGISKAVSLPSAFMKAADLLPVIVYGIDDKGEHKNAIERAEAARNLISAVEKLQKDVSWAIKLANSVIGKAGQAAVKVGTKVAANRAIARVRSAVSQFGTEATEAIMKRVTPALETVGEWFGESAAGRAAEGIISAIGQFASKLAPAAGKKAAIEAAVKALSTRLVLVFEVAEFAGSAPVALAIEALKFELYDIPILYGVALKSFDAWLSTGVFGMPVAQLKEQVRSKPLGPKESAITTIEYFYEQMFANADSQTRRGWPDVAQHGLLARGRFYGAWAKSSDTLLAELKKYYLSEYESEAARLLQQIALEYIDSEFRRVFQGREPPP